MDEIVFAIPTDRLWRILSYRKSGLIKGNRIVLNKIVQQSVFGRRCEMEEDPSYKQIIPYGIISHKDSFYLFKRKTGQRERRLHHKLHLGVGGHMNPGISGNQNELWFVNELKRELFEEISLFEDCQIENIRFVGIINDDSIPVGRVHIGLLYNIQLSNKNIRIKETKKMTAKWVSKKELFEKYEEIESWSRIAIENEIV